VALEVGEVAAVVAVHVVQLRVVKGELILVDLEVLEGAWASY
jgi:hypothetical protein